MMKGSVVSGSLSGNGFDVFCLYLEHFGSKFLKALHRIIVGIVVHLAFNP